MANSNKTMTIQRSRKSEKNLVTSISTNNQTMAMRLLKIDHSSSLKIMLDTTESGSLEPRSDKVREDRSGQMALCTKVGGWTTRPTVPVDSSTLTVTYMMDNGSTIRPTATVFTAILMELDMKVNGKRISNTAWVLRPGQMVQNSVDNTFRERNTVRVLSPGPMDQPILDNLLRTTSKEKENITGLTEENSMDHG